jgi:hypothetical protein
MLKHIAVIVLVGLSLSGTSIAQRSRLRADSLAGAPAMQASTTDKAVGAAKAFLATLDAAQRAKVSLPLNTTTRVIWSNLPTGIKLQSGALERNGMKLGAMTPAQEKAALALLAATLSPDGFQKVMHIVDADQVLEVDAAPKRQATSAIRFGRAEYYIAILGTPSPTDLWMLQFGGHHLAINVSAGGRQSVLTPTHTGAQPATYTLNGRTIRPLGDENDKAFKLINALDAAQQKQAILGFEVRNLVLGPGTDGKAIQPEGIRASSLRDDQRAMLLDLVREWVGILDEGAASAKMAEVKANLADTSFAWSGSTASGQPAYFRIQGPTVVIEYAPQGQGAAATDHIHTIYRDPTNDYGPKLTAR